MSWILVEADGSVNKSDFVVRVQYRVGDLTIPAVSVFKFELVFSIVEKFP